MNFSDRKTLYWRLVWESTDAIFEFFLKLHAKQKPSTAILDRGRNAFEQLCQLADKHPQDFAWADDIKLLKGDSIPVQLENQRIQYLKSAFKCT